MTINIDKDNLLNFFSEITDNKSELTYVKNLIKVYPDILDYMINDKIPDLSKTKYTKIKRYTALSEKVKANIDLLYLNNELYNAFDISFLKKIYVYFLNKFESNNYISDIKSIIIKNIKYSPYDTLCKLSNIAFVKADKILLNAYNKAPQLWNFNLRSSNYRCVSFILWYLINNLNGSTFTYIDAIKRDMRYKYNISDCLATFNEAIKDKRFTIINDKIMLTSSFLEEKNISNYIHEALKSNQSWNIDVSKYSKVDNFKLTEDQLKTLEYVNNNQLVLLNGYAGSGKSSSIKALINMLEDNNKSYILLAPTAKAAKQISLYTDRLASTIHYRLCKDYPNFDHGIKNESEYEIASNLNKYYEKDLGVLDYDIIIIDETSMLSIQLFNMLLKYINPKYNKVLLIGDSYQLPSIQDGNLYQDLLDIKEIPKVTLNEIFRYTEDGLINVATNIRLGKKYLTEESIQHIGNSYTFYKYENVNEMINAALNKYLELINSGYTREDIAVLTAKNIGSSGTNLVNSCIQHIINPIDEFDDTISIIVGDNKITFKENDLVMNIKNNYNAKILNSDEKTLLANGQIGVIKYVDEVNKKMIVEIEDNEFEFEYPDICNLRLAYCFTIHKAQGSQFKNVIYLTSNDDMFMTNSNLCYVAITRAQKNCYHFGDDFVINSKISERENLKRNTTLTLQFNNVL